MEIIICCRQKAHVNNRIKYGFKNKSVILKFARDFTGFICLQVCGVMPVTQGERKLVRF